MEHGDFGASLSILARNSRCAALVWLLLKACVMDGGVEWGMDEFFWASLLWMLLKECGMEGGGEWALDEFVRVVCWEYGRLENWERELLLEWELFDGKFPSYFLDDEFWVFFCLLFFWESLRDFIAW